MLPESFIVSCYPNPFNGTTTIRFYVDEVAALHPAKLIKVYNALGQLVAVYELGNLKSGFHQFNLNAVDYWGNALPSGLYFITLQIGDQSMTKRVTLMK